MIHRQSITVLVAASLNLAGTAPLRASDSDGVEVRLAAGDLGDEVHDDLGEGLDDLAEGTRHDDGGGQLDQVALHQEVLETLHKTDFPLGGVVVPRSGRGATPPEAPTQTPAPKEPAA